MTHNENLRDGIQYDQWANKRWLECLTRKNGNDSDRAILGHILSAQKIWLMRCHGTSLDKMPVVELDEKAIHTLSYGWMAAVGEFGDEQVISYYRTTGEEMSSSFGSIILHVLNHGTYHRGELRGLYKARSDTDFPETDRILFSFQKE